ncbi:hypothetical protein BU14_0014s0060 [Porphyra umbilicalis]|uniref:Methyltransferase type 11 domain-containing protein n=1 Tax=Porphyra umbilicalis TaxID=2786 RepID=A0A1X6PL28_PORUM|nr:hypothetical protein BU14_0014s0060 [Porphyra umbilicalis]|eukprot:OSX81510.1 hypothetical protein BU14_0014s0060 [Porphyra umbilicalis]
MLAVAAAKLGPYPTTATTAVMDGQALTVGTGTYDVGVSVFGVMTFPDWRAGLAELVRAVRPRGRVGLTTWACPDGAGYFPTLLNAYAAAFPAKARPSVGGGVAALSKAAAVAAALTTAGCTDVAVEAVTVPWVGPPLADAVAELIPGVQRAPFYAALGAGEREHLHATFVATLEPYVGGGTPSSASPVRGWWRPRPRRGRDGAAAAVLEIPAGQQGARVVAREESSGLVASVAKAHQLPLWLERTDTGVAFAVVAPRSWTCAVVAASAVWLCVAKRAPSLHALFHTTA